MNQFTRHQPDINRLVSQLRIRIRPRYRNMKQPEGPSGRLKLLRATVTALFKYERIELSYPRADEARGYAEMLISEAIRNGDSHEPTMNTASFWLEEKELVHKLFKVLAPRFSDYQSSYTALFKTPLDYPNFYRSRSLLELKGNPFPPIIFDGSRNKNLIQNILLDEARKEFKKSKQTEIIAKISSSAKPSQNSSVNTEAATSDTLSKAAAEISEGEELLKSSSVEHEDLNSSATSKAEMNINIGKDPSLA